MPKDYRRKEGDTNENKEQH